MFVQIVLILATTVAVDVESSDILKRVYFNRVHCKANADVCPNPICKISFISRDVKSFTWICNLVNPVDHVKLQVTLYYRFRSGYSKFLIDVNIDVCAYYKNTLGNALIDLVRKEVEQYSTNFIVPCPYTGNMSIVAMPLTGALFDYIFLPSGDYKLVIDGKFDKKNLFGILITTYFSVPAGLTLEDDKMG